MPATSMAEVRQVGERLYDQGHTDPRELAALIARAVGPGGAIYAGVVASQVTAMGKEAVTNVTGNVSDIAGVVRDVADLPTRIGRWLSEPGTWLRIGYVVLGSAMILIGVRMLTAGADRTALGAVTGMVSKAENVKKTAARARKVVDR